MGGGGGLVRVSPRYQRVFLTLRQASLSIRLLTTESSPPTPPLPYSGQYIGNKGKYHSLGLVALFGGLDKSIAKLV